MSHFSQVKTALHNKHILIETLTQLGYHVDHSPQGVEVRGFMGQFMRADLKVTTEINYDIGFVMNEQGSYELVADWDVLQRSLGITRDQWLAQVKREYARASILEVAKSKGLEVECKEENGMIQMVVSQW